MQTKLLQTENAQIRKLKATLLPSFSVQILSIYYFRHVANGEILGVALLMDDVLQTGVQDITVLTDRPTEGDKKGDKKGKAGSEKRASSAAGNSKMGMCMPFC